MDGMSDLESLKLDDDDSNQEKISDDPKPIIARQEVKNSHAALIRDENNYVKSPPNHFNNSVTFKVEIIK